MTSIEKNGIKFSTHELWRHIEVIVMLIMLRNRNLQKESDLCSLEKAIGDRSDLIWTWIHILWLPTSYFHCSGFPLLDWGLSFHSWHLYGKQLVCRLSENIKDHEKKKWIVQCFIQSSRWAVSLKYLQPNFFFFCLNRDLGHKARPQCSYRPTLDLG